MHVKRTKELDDNHPSKNDRKAPKVIAKLVTEGRYLILEMSIKVQSKFTPNF